MTDSSDRQDRATSTSSSISSNLLEGIKAFDGSAWDQMVGKYYPLVYAWCRAVGLSEHDAADVCQDTFRSVASSINNFHRNETGDTFGGWLRRIAQRRISDHRKKAKEAGTAAGGTDVKELLDNVVADLSSTSSGNVPNSHANLRRVLEYVKQEFEEVSWRAFMMTTVEELSPTEAAHQLGISRNAVYLAKSRILKRVRMLLADQSQV